VLPLLQRGIEEVSFLARSAGGKKLLIVAAMAGCFVAAAAVGHYIPSLFCHARRRRLTNWFNSKSMA
jgi:hypothetical protein